MYFTDIIGSALIVGFQVYNVCYPVKKIMSSFNLPSNIYNNNNKCNNNILNTDYDNYKTNCSLDFNANLIDNVSKSVGNNTTKSITSISLLFFCKST